MIQAVGHNINSSRKPTHTPTLTPTLTPTPILTLMSPTASTLRQSPVSTHTPSQWPPRVAQSGMYPAPSAMALSPRQLTTLPAASVNPAAYGSYTQIPSSANPSMPASPSRMAVAAAAPAEPSPRAAEGGVKLSTTNLYIKGLHKDTTDMSLRKLVQDVYRYGTIVSTKAVLDPQTNLCKGFGFVDFETAECAQAALEALSRNGLTVAMAKKQEQADTNVFFKNLPEHMTKEELEAMVKECGSVSSVHIMKQQNGRSPVVGFARMACKEDCEKIIKRYNNVTMAGNKEPLLVKFADLPNRQKSHQNRSLAAQEYQGAVALAQPHGTYLLQGPAPQTPLSVAAQNFHENSVGMPMVAQPPGIPQVPAGVPTLQGLMAMTNGYPAMPPYPSLPAAAASVGYVSVAPTQATYPTLPHHYGADMFATQGSTTASYYFQSSAPPTMQQVVPGMQAAMDPTMGSLPQWQ